MLRIKLLGSEEILDTTGRMLRLQRRKSRALVYYLAANADPVTREHLLTVFWSDLERSAALQTLRTTLHYLRKALGEALIVEDERVGLAPEVEVDTRRLTRALQQSSKGQEIENLQEALDLYDGDFLADFSLPDTAEFEEWLTVQREYYRRQVINGLVRLSRHYESLNDLRRALEMLERALAINPLQEDLQRESIRLLYLSGDRPGAIRRYDQLRRMLDEELGVPPMAETRALYDAIITDRLISSGQAPQQTTRPLRRRRRENEPELPFAGRQAELAHLQELVGPGKMILIEGEPGIGKTRLADQFRRGLDAVQLSGAGRELEQGLPYQPLVEALRGLLREKNWPQWRVNLAAQIAPIWLGEIGRLVPDISGSLAVVAEPAEEVDESRLWEGITQFLLALAAQKPVVLFIDDLQWADEATLGVLGYLVRRNEAMPITLLATARPAPARAPLAKLLHALIREDRLARISLPRLDRSEIEAISEKISPDYRFPLAEWLSEISEGIPYVLAELVRYARENDILVAGGVLNLDRLSAGPVVPRTVYNLIQSRLDRLSEAARRTLDAAVAAGREFDFEVVTRAAALSDSAAYDALGELSEAGFVQPLEGTRYRFDHNLTMEVAYQEMGDPRHRMLHRRVAEAMESLYGPARLETLAGVVAFHFSEGNAADRAAPYARTAGEQAARLAAWKAAVAFFDQALEGTTGAARFPLLMSLGEIYLRSGPAASSSEAFREALHVAQQQRNPGQVDAARLALGRSLLPQARFGEVIALARRVLAEGLPENAHNAEFLWGTALSLEGADLVSAAEHLQAAARLCREQEKLAPAQKNSPEESWHAQAADAAFPARIKFELGSVKAQQGDLQEAVALYREALELACGHEQEETVIWCVLAHNNLAYHSHLLGDPDAVEYVKHGLRIAEERGMFGQQPYLFSTLGEIALTGGDLDRAEKYFKEGLALAERLEIAERIAGLEANLGRVAVERGETTMGLHLLSKALAKAEDLGTHHLAAQIRLWLAPLLPRDQALKILNDVRAFAERGARRFLLQQVAKVEERLPAGGL